MFAHIRRERVGGAFWAAPPECRTARHIVSFPQSESEARQLWHRVCARVGDEPKLAIDHFGGRGNDLLREIAEAGGHYLTRKTDLRDMLLQGASVWSTATDNCAVLGLIYGAPVNVWPDGSNGPERGDPRHAHTIILDGTRYFCPFTGQATDAATAIGFLGNWRRMIDANRHVAVCVGMSWWKRARLAKFLSNEERPLFRRSAYSAVATAARRHGDIAVWSSRVPSRLRRYADRHGVGIQLVEDGFIRSVGLGSDLLPPSSIVVDAHGMYFDPSQPSDLEILLISGNFTPEDRGRARRLIDLLVSSKISKYGAGPAPYAPHIGARPGQVTILVPGQVADDLSIRLGAKDIDGNLSLLKRVRQENHDAWIVYRPHPDVDAGHRQGAIPDDEILQYANQIGRGGTITAWIEASSEIHTMTSLAGFEGLLRERRVVTYGQPFYAGWGLTADRAPRIPRRNRSRNLEELVAATLIFYPRYLDPVTELPCGPEILVSRLNNPDLWRPSLTMRVRRLQGRVRRYVAMHFGVWQTSSRS